MDTANYLTNQGWRGEGHALHISGRGITKPIRVSQKSNVLGLGKKKHDAHADQWWARAFDDTLKGINTTRNDTTGKTEGISFGAGAQALQMAGRTAKWVGQGDLYRNFVRGEGLTGTMEPKKEIRVEEDKYREGHEVNGDVRTADGEKRERGKKRKRHAEAETLENSKKLSSESATLDIEHLHSKSKHGHPRDDPRGAETKEERRQRRYKRARKALRTNRNGQNPPGHHATNIENTAAKSFGESKNAHDEKLHTETLLTLKRGNRRPDDSAKPAKRKKHRIESREKG